MSGRAAIAGLSGAKASWPVWVNAGSAGVIEAVNRAMIGLDAYWARHGTPDSRVIAQVHAKLEERSSTCDDDWQALLVAVMHDLGYDIELRGEEIHALKAAGIPRERDRT